MYVQVSSAVLKNHGCSQVTVSLHMQFLTVKIKNNTQIITLRNMGNDCWQRGVRGKNYSLEMVGKQENTTPAPHSNA